jgi:hypothetical protein
VSTVTLNELVAPGLIADGAAGDMVKGLSGQLNPGDEEHNATKEPKFPPGPEMVNVVYGPDALYISKKPPPPSKFGAPAPLESTFLFIVEKQDKGLVICGVPPPFVVKVKTSSEIAPVAANTNTMLFTG